VAARPRDGVPAAGSRDLHLVGADSDRGNPAVLAMLTVTAAATTFLLLFRLLRRSWRRKPRRPPAAVVPAGRGPRQQREPAA
jgi:hypothetical protein